MASKSPIPSDIEIAQNATLLPIQEIGAKLGLGVDPHVHPRRGHLCRVLRAGGQPQPDRAVGVLVRGLDQLRLEVLGHVRRALAERHRERPLADLQRFDLLALGGELIQGDVLDLVLGDG